MDPIRITSVGTPFDTTTTARQAMEVISRAQGMGLLRGLTIDHLDGESFRRLTEQIADAGIGREMSMAWARGGPEPAEVSRLLERLQDALETSPAPEYEWPALLELFGPERLADLTDTSPASVRRYAAASRRTPDPVAVRLHHLATIVGDLRGAYNDAGIRRWFERPREALDGRRPEDLLAGDWNPDEPGPQRVRELAASLIASPAT